VNNAVLDLSHEENFRSDTSASVFGSFCFSVTFLWVTLPLLRLVSRLHRLL
jgi:hypothetical protein